ncbi:hypothetical protein EYR40_009198 [Pleurotus pulmonarius]|nr:hypothetical protein EYR40_010914 [Pleurotus pulmonarius]KAF4590603.1 hypothetical protein EYR40_009198 [Pleurotus pulmonarius]
MSLRLITGHVNLSRNGVVLYARLGVNCKPKPTKVCYLLIPNLHLRHPQPSLARFNLIMVSALDLVQGIPVPLIIRDQFAFVDVRHYCATAHLPTTRRIPLHNQRPCLDGLFSEDTAQPRRHDVIVNVMLGQKANQFHIFFRERGRSPLNDSLRDAQSRRAWPHRSYGDVIVLRRGQRKPYVNIRATERKMENAAVKSFLRRLRLKGARRIPQRFNCRMRR